MRRAFSLLIVLTLTLGPFAQGFDMGDVAPPSSSVKDLEPPTTAPAHDARELLSNIGGSFTENSGQKGEGAGLYYCEGDPLSVSFGPGWVSYLHRPGHAGRGVLVRVEFPGALNVVPEGAGALPHRTNVMKGKDPDDWVEGARNFRELVYRDIYDGIDLRFYFKEGMLKYDVLVSPHTDASLFKMRYLGAQELAIDPSTGDLIIRTPLVDLVDAAPITFQGDTALSSRFVIEDDVVSFQVDGRQPGEPVVIDPGLIFSTYIGGSDTDHAFCMVENRFKETILCGITWSTDFPTTFGVLGSELRGNTDIFICSLDSDGTDLLFSTYVGGHGNETAYCIDIDDEGNLVIGGATDSSDFPTTSGAYMEYPIDWADCFLMSITPDGSAIAWSTLYAGSGDDWLYWFKFTQDDDIIVAGSTLSPDLPMVDGCFDTEANGNWDTFLARFNGNGSRLVSATYLGGSREDNMWLDGAIWESNAMTVDDEDSVYIATMSDSSNYPVTQGVYQSSLNGGFDIVVTKIDGSLSSLLYSTYIGGWNGDVPWSLDVDSQGCVVLGGVTLSWDFPVTPGAYDDGYNRTTDYVKGFLLKLSSDGSELVYSTYFGGSGEDNIQDVRLLDDDLVCFVMETIDDELPTTVHAIGQAYGGKTDTYLGVLDGENQTLRYGSYIGGAGEERWPVLARTDGASVYVMQSTGSLDFPISPDAYQRGIGGNLDVAVTKLELGLVEPALTGPPTDLAAGIENRSVKLGWNPPLNPGGFNLLSYRIYRGTSDGDLSRIMEVDVTERTFLDTPPQLGGRYHYAVSAVCPLGEGPLTETVEILYVTPPDPPKDLWVNAGCGTVGLGWTPPEFTGGRPLLGHHVLKGTDPSNMTLLATLVNETILEDDDVVNGVYYHYSIVSFNIYFNCTDPPTMTAYPTGPPTTPRSFEAIPGDGDVHLRWMPPASDGGLRLWGYRILRGLTADALYALGDVDDLDTEYVDASVENGLVYHYAIKAYNSLGYGPTSLVVSAMPSGPPDMPRHLVATRTIGLVTLDWDPPLDTGGLPLAGYTVLRGTSEAHLAPIATTVGTTYADAHPPTGRYLYYAVYANNSAGQGPRTPAVDIWPLDLAGPVRGLEARAGMGSVSLSWRPSESDGGTEVLRYVILRSTGLEADYERLKNVSAETLSYVDLTAIPGTTYQYAVMVITLAGEGAWNITTAMPYTLPSAPLSLSRSPTTEKVVLTWASPQEDGWSPILTYRVYRGSDHDRLTLVAEVEGTTFTDANVAEGAFHYYAVSAVNAGGEGPRTDAILAGPGVPVMPPGPPTNLKASADGTTVTLRWDPPTYDGGAAVTGYAILRGISEGDLREVALMGIGTRYVDAGLAEGCTYVYAVRAMNAVGMGTVSRTVSVEVAAAVDLFAPDSPTTWLVAGVLVVLVIAGAWGVSEPFRYALLILLMPLFSRIHKKEVLDNKTRFAILGIIMERPGIHYSALREEFGLSNGGAAHHLDVLERESFIRSVSDGRLKRFYTVHTKVPERRRLTPEEIREAVIGLVRTRPNVSQLQVMEELGIDRDTIGYHLRTLVRERVLEATRQGRYKVYTLNGRK